MGQFYQAGISSLVVATNKIYTGSRNQIFRHGRFAILTVVFGVTTACDGGELLFTMPQGYKARGSKQQIGESVYTYARCDDGSIGLFTVNGNGISSEVVLPAQSVWRMTGVYVVDVYQ